MKTRLLALSLTTLLTSVGHAQLDRLLVPVASPRAPAPVAGSGATNFSTTPTASAGTLTAEMLIGELEKELRSKLAISGELKLTLSRPWQPMPLPAPDVSVVIVETPSGGLGSSMLLRTKIISAGETVAELQVALGVQLWQEVWMAMTRLDRGQPLNRDVLSLQKVDVLRERQTLIQAETDPATLELSQGVAAGHLLTPERSRTAACRPKGAGGGSSCANGTTGHLYESARFGKRCRRGVNQASQSRKP